MYGHSLWRAGRWGWRWCVYRIPNLIWRLFIHYAVSRLTRKIVYFLLQSEINNTHLFLTNHNNVLVEPTVDSFPPYGNKEPTTGKNPYMSHPYRLINAKTTCLNYVRLLNACHLVLSPCLTLQDEKFNRIYI